MSSKLCLIARVRAVMRQPWKLGKERLESRPKEVTPSSRGAIDHLLVFGSVVSGARNYRSFYESVSGNHKHYFRRYLRMIA